MNHISSDCPWLNDHPEISYNNRNTPQLIPAIELDLILSNVCEELCQEKFQITDDHQIDIVMERIENALNKIRFEEYWFIGLDTFYFSLSSSFSVVGTDGYSDNERVSDSELQNALKNCVYEGRIGHRFPLVVDVTLLKKLLTKRIICPHELKGAVNAINEHIRIRFVKPAMETILRSVRNSIQYKFIHRNPESKIPSARYPLVERYFTCISRHSPVDSYYSLVTENEAERNIFAVNNGWTWSNSRDPLNEHPTSRCYILRDDFASYQMATSYLLRDVVAWTDCVKVRYYEGDQPTWIMPIMEEYVQISAYIFDGFRLDNCHNASISLLEHLTTKARNIKPSLALLAELFTSDESLDIEYIRRVGIDMIVRETVKDPHEYHDSKVYSDVLYSAGGEDLGSLQNFEGIPHYITNSRLPIVLYDVTHDNRSFRNLYGLASIPSVTVMISLTVAHVASTRGQDEGYICNPSVTEKRKYAVANSDLASMSNEQIVAIRKKLLEEEPSSSPVHLSGNIYLRLLMNNLHQLMSREQYVERYVHSHEYTNCISIERRQPGSHYSVLSVTNSSFFHHCTKSFSMNVVGRVEGVFVSVLCDAKDGNMDEEKKVWKKKEVLSGIDFSLDIRCDRLHDFCQIHEDSGGATLNFTEGFLPGSSVVILLYSGNKPKPDHLLDYHECNPSFSYVL